MPSSSVYKFAPRIFGCRWSGRGSLSCRWGTGVTGARVCGGFGSASQWRRRFRGGCGTWTDRLLAVAHKHETIIIGSRDFGS